MDIVLFWIQGSWKWTISKILCKQYNFDYFDLWNILRSLRLSDNYLWNYIKEVIDRWDLLEDEIVTSFFDTFLVMLKIDQKMLLDWYPRTIWQYYLMKERIKKIKRRLIWIYLDIDEDLAFKRITWRRVCQDCWSIYNIYNDWDIKICKNCWGKIYIRDDDKEDIVLKRFENFKKYTKPAIDIFQNDYKLFTVDASRQLDEIMKDIKLILCSNSIFH